MISLEDKKDLDHKKERLEKQIRIFSFVRLLLVVAIVVFIICLITLEEPVLYGCLSAGFILVMVILCIVTNPIYHQLKMIKNLELVYKKHENRRKLSYQSFSPDGKEFIDYKHYMELDLDLLGPRSLFQYLCCAKSKEGRRKLALQLTNPVKKDEKFQNCVSVLAESSESLKLEAAISSLSNDAKDCEAGELLALTKKKATIPLLGWILLVCSYAIMIGLLIVLLVNKIQPFYVLFFIPINFVIARKFSHNEVFDVPAIKYAEYLEAYEVLARDVMSLKLEDPYFQEIQQKLTEELPAIKKIKSVFDMLSYRQNLILSIIGNGLIFLDFIIALIYNQRTKKLVSIEKSLDLLSELELMLSLATIGLDQEVYSLPKSGDHLKVVNGYHPLVRNCVPNSFDLTGGVILTGSNMSGKTTFMRMLGLNQVLANAGGLVCAESFSSQEYTIVTSLRATDMLQEGISTFYAEVNRMKNIMDTSESGHSLVLVDEIFKGTNAKDRIYAAFQIIDKLNSFGVPFIITTHDFELCEAKNIINYHFDEEYQEDKIYFDYMIKEGKCNKTNAIYLLKMAGVLPKE